LQEIIDDEPKDRPYSDDDLVEQLGKRGITLARRTVTKYRKAMKIPSSRQRRDWKLAKTTRSRRSPAKAVAATREADPGPMHVVQAADADSGEPAAN